MSRGLGDVYKRQLQRTCEVVQGDTPETLAARVFRAECEAYPEAIRTTLKTLGFDADQ